MSHLVEHSPTAATEACRSRRETPIELPDPDVAKALGLARRANGRRKSDGMTCEDCFFYRQMLCALDLDEPCSTFRADSPEGLVPPRQPALLPRS